jgi:hypothetical protein
MKSRSISNSVGDAHDSVGNGLQHAIVWTVPRQLLFKKQRTEMHPTGGSVRHVLFLTRADKDRPAVFRISIRIDLSFWFLQWRKPG